MDQEDTNSFENIFQKLSLLCQIIKQSESQLKHIQKKYLVASTGRGRNSAIAGQQYELKVWNIVNKLKFIKTKKANKQRMAE